MNNIWAKTTFNILSAFSSYIFLYQVKEKPILIIIPFFVLSVYFTFRVGFLFSKITYYGYAIQETNFIDAKKKLEIIYIDVDIGILELRWNDVEERFLETEPESIKGLKVGDIIMRPSEKDIDFVLVKPENRRNTP